MSASQWKSPCRHVPDVKKTHVFQNQYIITVLVSHRCCDKLSLLWWLKITCLCYLIVLEVRRPKWASLGQCQDVERIAHLLGAQEASCLPWLLVSRQLSHLSDLNSSGHLFLLWGPSWWPWVSPDSPKYFLCLKSLNIHVSAEFLLPWEIIYLQVLGIRKWTFWRPITLLIRLNLPSICSKDVLKKQDFEDVGSNWPNQGSLMCWMWLLICMWWFLNVIWLVTKVHGLSLWLVSDKVCSMSNLLIGSLLHQWHGPR